MARYLISFPRGAGIDAGVAPARPAPIIPHAPAAAARIDRGQR